MLNDLFYYTWRALYYLSVVKGITLLGAIKALKVDLNEKKKSGKQNMADISKYNSVIQDLRQYYKKSAILSVAYLVFGAICYNLMKGTKDSAEVPLIGKVIILIMVILIVFYLFNYYLILNKRGKLVKITEKL